jgi:hypothetical protein
MSERNAFAPETPTVSPTDEHDDKVWQLANRAIRTPGFAQ